MFNNSTPFFKFLGSRFSNPAAPPPIGTLFTQTPGPSCIGLHDDLRSATLVVVGRAHFVIGERRSPNRDNYVSVGSKPPLPLGRRIKGLLTLLLPRSSPN